MSQASKPLAEYAAALGDEIVVLTERNRPVAAIVPLKRTDREALALSNHPEFLGIIARSRADVRAGRTVSLDAMKQLFPSKRPNTTIGKRREASSKKRRRPARD